jgi:hypothetical protein
MTDPMSLHTTLAHRRPQDLVRPRLRLLCGAALLASALCSALAAHAQAPQPYGYEPEKRAGGYESDAYLAVTCESQEGRLNRCPARTVAGVYLERRLSDTPCVYEQSWGYDHDGIWVDRGCRAVFRVPVPVNGDPGDEQVIFCASDRNRRDHCYAETRWGVRLYRQVSRSECVYGETWGYDRQGVWVERGCRGYFVLGEEQASDSGVLRCESDRGRLRRCRLDDEYGGNRGYQDQGGQYQVRLLQQLSRSDCLLGKTWGYTTRDVWVDDGCRAEFLVVREAWPGEGELVRCESDGQRRRHCTADTHRGVELIDELSRSPCIYGTTWGYDGAGIWVDRGCRADFRLGVLPGPGGRPPGSRPPSGYEPDDRLVTCESDDNRRRLCPADTRGGVELVDQFSRSACIFGTTWGYDRAGIWVDRGCRAQFRLGGRRPR